MSKTARTPVLREHCLWGNRHQSSNRKHKSSAAVMSAVREDVSSPRVIWSRQGEREGFPEI